MAQGLLPCRDSVANTVTGSTAQPIFDFFSGGTQHGQTGCTRALLSAVSGCGEPGLSAQCQYSQPRGGMSATLLVLPGGPLERTIRARPQSLSDISEFMKLSDLVSLLTVLDRQAPTSGREEASFDSTSLVEAVASRAVRVKSTGQDVVRTECFTCLQYGDADMRLTRSLLQRVHSSIQGMPFDFSSTDECTLLRIERFPEQGHCIFSATECPFTFQLQTSECLECGRTSALSCTLCHGLLGACRQCSSLCPTADCEKTRVCDDCSLETAGIVVGCMFCKFPCLACHRMCPMDERVHCSGRNCGSQIPDSTCMDCMEEVEQFVTCEGRCKKMFCDTCWEGFFCGKCSEAFCLGCKDVFLCGECGETYCLGCKDCFFCGECSETYCLGCKDVFFCGECSEAFCLGCKDCSYRNGEMVCGNC